MTKSEIKPKSETRTCRSRACSSKLAFRRRSPKASPGTFKRHFCHSRPLRISAFGLLSSFGIRHSDFLLTLLLLLPCSPVRAQEQPKPLPQLHAHNDYEHKRPLFDALDHGFCSVEAD